MQSSTKFSNLRIFAPPRSVRPNRLASVRAAAKKEVEGHKLSVSPQLVLGLSLMALGAASPSLAHDLTNLTGSSSSDLHTHVSPVIGDLGAQEEFWANMARYGRFFLTVMAGTAYVMLKPIAGWFKNPVTGILGLAFIGGTAYFIYFTVNAMLGVTDPVGYEPSSIVTPYGL